MLGPVGFSSCPASPADGISSTVPLPNPSLPVEPEDNYDTVPLPPTSSHTHFALPPIEEPTLDHFQFTFKFPSDNPDIPAPQKSILTTVSAKTSEEAENRRSLRALDLARASRNVIAANVQYHHLRISEIDTMRTIIVEECEEAEARLKQADEEIRYMLDQEGLGELEKLRDQPMFDSLGKEPSGNDDIDDDSCPSDATG